MNYKIYKKEIYSKMSKKQKLLIEWMNKGIFSRAESEFKQELARLTKIDIDRFREKVRQGKKQEFDKAEYVTDAGDAYQGYHLNFLLTAYIGILASLELEKPDEVILPAKEGLGLAGYVRFCGYNPLLFDVHVRGPRTALKDKLFLDKESYSRETLSVQSEDRLENRIAVYHELDSLEKIRDKKVLILDGTIETMRTLSAIYQLLKRYKPKKIRATTTSPLDSAISYIKLLPIKPVRYSQYNAYHNFEYGNMPVPLFKELLEKAQEQFIKNI